MKKLFGLKDLLTEQIQDLYDAEMKYAAMLPALVCTATASELSEHLRTISSQTGGNATQLALICDLLGVPAYGVNCHAMDGLVREAKDTTQDWGDTATIDAALIANAQRIVHYEIAGFGTARAFASCIGEKEVFRLLGEMLEQAVGNDKALTKLATGGWFSAGINDESAKAAA